MKFPNVGTRFFASIAGALHSTPAGGFAQGKIANFGLAFILMTAIAATACGGGGAGGSPSPKTDFQYDLTEDGKGIVITKYAGKGGKVVIPAEIDGLPVTTIGAYAFKGDTRVGEEAETKEKYPANYITSLYVPDSVTTLKLAGNGAISNLKRVTEIRLSDNIEYIAFIDSCPKLEKINLPKNLKRMNYMFGIKYCPELTDLVIPDTITSIEFGKYDENNNDAWVPIGGQPKYGDVLKMLAPFGGDGKLPIPTRKKLQALGYTGSF